MSNIAPYNEKEKKKKEKRKKEANNEPKRAINEMQTETREEKNEKNQHMSRIPWQFQCPGVSPFLLYQRQFYTAVIQT